MRLSKIVTRTGDDGTTGLADGTRLSKHDKRIIAMGDVDELNSQIGLLLSETCPGNIRDELLRIQHDLFDLGAMLAIPGSSLNPESILRLDAVIAQHNAALSPLREFILPGGSRAAALCHVARAVARRSERNMADLAEQDRNAKESLPYLNRLSDLLFVLARRLNAEAGVTENFWRGPAGQ
ncbi:MAG: cob(I)yrinic acid a,c-diamide adenosyltransferase [Gallionella sp.]|jgi:cob(I)alamin adenosyltransferase|nr:cob(I)yrinic acid a,c-diamide adenosyltransferase [Gallionella sp.]